MIHAQQAAWECPRCHLILAPFQSSCRCQQKPVRATTYRKAEPHPTMAESVRTVWQKVCDDVELLRPGLRKSLDLTKPICGEFLRDAPNPYQPVVLQATSEAHAAALRSCVVELETAFRLELSSPVRVTILDVAPEKELNPSPKRRKRRILGPKSKRPHGMFRETFDTLCLAQMALKEHGKPMDSFTLQKTMGYDRACSTFHSMMRSWGSNFGIEPINPNGRPLMWAYNGTS